MLLPLATLNMLVTAILVTVSELVEPMSTERDDPFPYLPDDVVVSVQRGPEPGRRRAAPTAPSARRCAG